MDAEKEAVIKEIRTLIVTCKNGLFMKRLMREYKEITGEYIPFRKFGFDTIEQFLRSTNQFMLTSYDGDFVLMAKPTEKSAHISKLIQCQNNTKKKRSNPPRFIRSNYNFGSQQRNYGSSSSSQYGNCSTRYQPSKPAFVTKNVASNNNDNYSYQSSMAKPSVPFANTTNNNNQIHSQPTASALIVATPPAKIQTPNPFKLEIPNERQSKNPFINDGRHNVSMTEQRDANTSQSSQPVQRQQPEQYQRENEINDDDKSKRMADAFGIRPKRNEYSIGSDQRSDMHSIVQREQARRLAEENEERNVANGRETAPAPVKMFTTPITNMLDRHRKNSRQQALKEKMLAQQVSKLELDTKPKVNIQSRLQLPKKSPDSFELASQRRIEPEPEPTIETFDSTELDACDSAIEAITLYCSKKKFPEPAYKFVEMPSKQFICSVEVDNVRYACYPNEFKTHDDAQKATAEIALLEIKEFEECKKYPECQDSPHDIAQQINACIGENGVFLDSLQTVFQSAYQQSLPKEWRLFIQGNADLFTLELNNCGKAIVYPKRPKLVDAHTSQFKLRPIQIDQIKTINLPWAKKEWNIFVATVKSIDDIRGFLYAEDDKDNLAETIERYEQKLMTGERKEAIASNIRIGGFYYTTYVEINRTRVMRIQVLDVDHSRRKAQCHFIDLGEEELVSFDRIYVLDPSLLEIPAQAIRFSLADLNVFDDDEQIECEAINLLFNDHLIAEIKTTETEYLCSGNDPKIKAIFHYKNPDTNKTINLNLKIAMAASIRYFEYPEMEDDRLVNAIVTYVDDFGIIYCHLCNENAMTYICALIKQLTANGIDAKYLVKHSLSAEDVYLVYDEYDEAWYRGMLLNLEPTDDLLFKLIDYGMMARINIKNVYSLKHLSDILNAFPAQAVNVRLHNDGARKKEFIECLQRYLRKGDVVTMNVVEMKVIPLVKIWKRIDRAGIIDIFKMCSIETMNDDNSSVSSVGNAQSRIIQRMQNNYSNNA